MHAKFLIALPLLVVSIPAAELPLTGKPAPCFRLSNQNSADQSSFALCIWFSADSGKAAIVTFFASWCVPCRAELPVLQQITDSLSGKGLRLVAIAVEKDYTDSVKAMVKKCGLKCPVVVDGYGILAKRFELAADAKGQYALPQTIFIGRDGMVVSTRSGFDAKNRLVEEERILEVVKQMLD